MSERTCENCRWAHECAYTNPHSKDVQTWLECRINPPVVSPLDEAGNAYWPTVKAGDWCGKHAEKK